MRKSARRALPGLRACRGRRLRLEPLEDRRLLTTAPILLGLDPIVSFDVATAEGAPAPRIDTSVWVIDDTATWAGGSIQVTYQGAGLAEDSLVVVNTAGAATAGILTNTPALNDISYDDDGTGGPNAAVQIGTIAAAPQNGAGGNPLKIDLLAAAGPASVEALVEALAYSNAPGGGAAASRTIRIVLDDGSDNPSAARSADILVDAIDYGDAPDNYNTDKAGTLGAGHYARGPMLGSKRDSEPDGQPDPNAAGDDNAGEDDEDGVTWASGNLHPGQVATIKVVASAADAVLNAWVDFDGDGDWDTWGDERIFYYQELDAGENLLTFDVPANAVLGETFARFRLSTRGDNYPDDSAAGVPAADGEVEDYRIEITAPESLDFGDAPDDPWDPSYPTLASNDGARHVTTGPRLGTQRDAEPDGLPTANADGDDTDGAPDDEDGVKFDTALIPGQAFKFTVGNTLGGKLDAWIDFNGDGDWDDPGEKLFAASETLTAGSDKQFTKTVPAGAEKGETYARFRLSTAGSLSPDGWAADGEVEDYKVRIIQLDFGDAPDPTYPTLAANLGASHIITDLYLGAAVDAETDGQQTAHANGDDTNGTPDDEDGVFFKTALIAGENATIMVTASQAGGRLDAFIDFNADGDWTDAGEKIYNNWPLAMGPTDLTFAVPAGAKSGTTFARFRISPTGGLSPVNMIVLPDLVVQYPEGEVEDYEVTIGVSLDWGDAPSPYPTLAANDGASHRAAASGPILGTARDVDSDGQPNANALGDDFDLDGDDEDGVVFETDPLIAGQEAEMTVTISGGNAKLDAWIDYNGNGGWEANEHIFNGTSQSLIPGPNTVTFDVPATAAKGEAFARFRVSTAGGLQPDDAVSGAPAADGEVEDYRITITDKPFPYTEDFNDGLAQDFNHELGDWTVVGQEYVGRRTAPGSNAWAISTITIPGAPDPLGDVSVEAQVKFGDKQGDTFWSNGFIIFDYQDANNFKAAGAYAYLNEWVILEVTGGASHTIKKKAGEIISTGVDYNLELKLEGTKATLLVGGTEKVSNNFSSTFTGQVGLGGLNAQTTFDDFHVDELP